MKVKKLIIENGRWRSYIYSFFVLSMCVFSLNALDARPAEADLKVGVVDLNEVFEKYEKRKKLDAQLRDQEKMYQDTINQKKKELVGLKDKIQLLDLGSDERKKQEEIFERKNIELESYARFAEKNLVKTYKDSFEKLYLEVLSNIEIIGNRKQYDLIIKKEEPELKSGGISELQFKVGIKTVLYHSDAVDITKSVIDFLNIKYSK